MYAPINRSIIIKEMNTYKNQISQAVIRRLPKYYRRLGELKAKGISKVSSNELSKILGYTASQIRQDLNNFGGFGQQGYGYSVDNLYTEIEKILGLNKKYNMIIVGFGRLGQAMGSYIINNEPNFKIVGIFDIKQIVQYADHEEFKDAQIMTCEEISTFVKKHKVDVALITVPSYKAQLVAKVVANAGIKGIWNFTGVDLDIPDNIKVQNVHASDSLHALAYYLK